ncbi:crossover junction endodeoxyribonuclease RuvC [Sinomonas sp. P47F7]|uniref:crossover junction endodeoxyribonuclease RuvC n=2 Tax=unclassified Sinomonas TaxID=2646595 RepID=UPI003BF54C75
MNLRVLGVDPGLTRCGLGVVDVARDRRATLVGVGVVGTSAEQPLDARLLVIANAIDDWLERYEPEVVAVERVFSQLNVSTVMGVAQASGVVIAAAARRGVPVALHTPSEVKAAVTGSGRADKEAVTRMVTKILRLDAAPRPADAADALALALAHAWRGSAPGSPSAVGRTTAITATAMTPAQRAWVEAESKARRRT